MFDICIFLYKKTLTSDTSVGMVGKEAVTVQPETSITAKAEEKRQESELSEQNVSEAKRVQAEQRRQAESADKIEDVRKKIFLNELILFDFDSAILARTAQERLKRKAEWLNLNPEVTIIVEGHCDERGTNAYNLALGERRAQAVKAYLVDLGITASRVSFVSYGEERPFATGHFESAWSMNRRAHFVIE